MKRRDKKFLKHYKEERAFHQKQFNTLFSRLDLTREEVSAKKFHLDMMIHYDKKIQLLIYVCGEEERCC